MELDDKTINSVPEESAESEQTPVIAEETATEAAADETPSEKESTEELREAYEEATAEEKPDDGKKKKKKKKMSKKKIALICVASFILALGIAVGLFFLIGSLLAEPYEPVVVEFNNTMPDKPISFTASETELINAALSPTATEDQIKEAIAQMYARANYNKIHADNAIAVLRGEGKATIEFAGKKPSGSMIVRGIKAQSGNEFYYQKAAKVVKCSIDSIQTLLQNSLNQQERTYTNLTDTYYLSRTLKGKEAKILKQKETATIPFLSVGNPGKLYSYSNYEKFAADGYYLDDPREITNFKILKDYIVLKKANLKQGESFFEYDAEKKYYTLRFSLILEPGEAHEDCVRVARQYLRDSTDSKDLDFKRYDVVLQIWENGYLKKMHDDEGWHGDLDGTDTESSSWYESIIYYDFDQAIFSEADLELYSEGNYTTDAEGNKKYEVDNDTWAKKVIDRYMGELSGVKKPKVK